MSKLPRYYPFLMMTSVTAQLSRRIFPKWVEEGRFERAGVIIRWADMTVLMLYENGGLLPIPWEALVGDNDIAWV